MDLLSSVLRELRFESAGYRWLELGTPFRVRFGLPAVRGVHIIARGECDLILDPEPGAGEQVVGLATGDLVILPRGGAHVLRSTGGRRAPEVSSAELATRPDIRLNVGGTDTIVVCGAILIGEPDHPVLRGLPHVIHVPSHAAAWLAPFVELLQTEAFSGGRGSNLMMARLSDAMLVRALRHHSDTQAQPGWLAGLADPYLAKALAAMHTDPAHPWTVATLARTAGLSRAAFSARFTAHIGQPAIRYLQAIRMQRARTLLRDRRATVATVAAQVGYQSDLAFAAAFKRDTGTTPGAYRAAATVGQAMPDATAHSTDLERALSPEATASE